MKNQKQLSQVERLDLEIAVALDQLKGLDTSSQRYKDNVATIGELSEIREAIKAKRNDERFFGVSPDTILTGLVSISSVLLILKYEQVDILNSKALSIASKWLGK